jgi:hypothetical protein
MACTKNYKPKWLDEIYYKSLTLSVNSERQLQYCMRPVDLTALNMKISTICDLTQCNSVVR